MPLPARGGTDERFPRIATKGENMAKDTRGQPSLYRDYHGELYIVVDDEGEPVTDYYTDFEDARTARDNYCDVDGKRPWVKYRIASVGFKVLVPDDGSPVTIADDPRPPPLDAFRSMGADRASEDKAPNPPPDLSAAQMLAYLEGFSGAAEQWSADLLDRAALADEMAGKIRKGGSK